MRWQWLSGSAKFLPDRPRKSTGRPVGATVSIGLVHCDGPVLDVPELLAQADQALYFAKENGRNRVEVASLDMLLKRKDEAMAVSTTAMASMAAQSAA